MTTYIDFVPSQVQAPEFQITLDGSFYTMLITWNLFGQRYYFNLYTLNGDLIVSAPLIGSPVGLEIETLEWIAGNVLLTFETRHGLPVGDTANLTVSGVTPDAYNGKVSALVTSPTTISFALSVNPGEMTVTGVVSQDINLVAGYFSESTIVYRSANAQFEVSP